MFEKLGQERLALVSDFLVRPSLHDEVGSGSVQCHDEGARIVSDPFDCEDPSSSQAPDPFALDLPIHMMKSPRISGSSSSSSSSSAPSISLADWCKAQRGA